jgi:hypothetical protein
MINASGAQDILDNIPPERIETVQLLSRQTDGASASVYATGVNWTARRKKTDLKVIALMGGSLQQQWIDFQLFLVDGQTVLPQNGDRITDANGYYWDIQAVNDVHFAVIWTCHCIRTVGPSGPALPRTCPLATALTGGAAVSVDGWGTTERWYKFTGSGSGSRVITVAGTTGSPGVTIYSGTCDALTTLTTFTGNSTYTTLVLGAGVNVYVKLAGTNFTASVTAAMLP